MTRDHVQLLANEVDDYLELSSVGLYEFLWILNGDNVDGSRDVHLAYAQQALELLLKEGDTRLILLNWPGEEVVDELNRGVEPGDFDDPKKGVLYVAITRD